MSTLVIGCWGCKAAGFFGWGLRVRSHTCTFLSQCGFFFQPQENILQGCHANSIIDNSPVGAAVEATEQICVTQRPSVPAGFLHKHVSRDQTLSAAEVSRERGKALTARMQNIWREPKAAIHINHVSDYASGAAAGPWGCQTERGTRGWVSICLLLLQVRSGTSYVELPLITVISFTIKKK